MKAFYSIVALLGAIALAALFAAPLARAGLSPNGGPLPEPTMQASAAGQAPASAVDLAPASVASEPAPSAVDLGITVAPTNQQVIAALVEERNAFRALLAREMAPSHPAEIEALLRQEMLRQRLAVTVAPSHPAEIEALLQEHQAME